MAHTPLQGYPTTEPPKVVDVDCPLAHNDARRQGLLAHLDAVAREAVEATGAGCIFQVTWTNAYFCPSVTRQCCGTVVSVRPVAGW